MDFISKLREAIKAKGANAWTEEELDALFAEDGEIVTAVTSFVEEKNAEATEGLVKKNKELLGEKKKLQTKIASGSTEDIAEYETRIEELSQQLEQNQEAFQKLQREAEKNSRTWAAEKEKLSKALGTEKEGYNSMLIEAELASGLSQVALRPEHIPVVKKYLRDNIILVEDGNDRKAVARHIDKDGKEAQMSFADYVKTIWSTSEEGKAFIVSKASGSGVNSGARGSNDSGTDEGGEDENPFSEAFGE